MVLLHLSAFTLLLSMVTNSPLKVRLCLMQMQVKLLIQGQDISVLSFKKTGLQKHIITLKSRCNYLSNLSKIIEGK